MKHTVAVEIDGEVQVHIAGNAGDYLTLCGPDGGMATIRAKNSDFHFRISVFTAKFSNKSSLHLGF
jgi:hypothetical protein